MMMAIDTMMPLLNVEDVRKRLRIARNVVFDAMDKYAQSGGRIGLQYVRLGKCRRTRDDWVNDWIERESERSVAL